MNTPVRAGRYFASRVLATASGIRCSIHSWMPPRVAPPVGNVTFGGFVAGLIAAYVHGVQEGRGSCLLRLDEAVGNMIPVWVRCCSCRSWGTGYELCDYDASICPYDGGIFVGGTEMQGAMMIGHLCSPVITTSGWYGSGSKGCRAGSYDCGGAGMVDCPLS